MKINKSSIGRAFIFVAMLIAFLAIAMLLKWPQHFDSHVKADGDFRFSSYLLLVLYRFLVYLAFPWIVSLVMKLRSKRGFWIILVENYNIQFCTYAILTGAYMVFGGDKLLGTTIFDSSDAFMFVASFIFTLVLGMQINNQPKKEEKGGEEHK